jgi:23S rRNA (adenine1618-N6)-methyltransferase
VNIKSVIDIGTGSSIIYPLIGWKIFDWNFIGTEID